MFKQSRLSTSSILSVTKIVSLCAVLALLFAACSDDSPSSPMITNVAGTWTGSASITSSTPSSNCAALLFRLALPISESVRFSLQQSGSDITGTISDDAGESCPVSGTINGSTLTVSVTPCGELCTAFDCMNGEIVDICEAATVYTGEVSNNMWAGTVSDTGNTFISGTSTSTGSIMLDGTFSVTR